MVVDFSMPNDETPNPSSGTLNLMGRFRSEYRAHPGFTAIEAGATRLTYGEVGRQADAVAEHVRRLAVAPGDVVTILVADRVALVPVMLGVLQATCVFVPLNVDAPPARLLRLLEWLKPKLVITDESSYERIGPLIASSTGTAPILAIPHGLESIDESEMSPAGTTLPSDTDAPSIDSPSYIYFTSGSTGQPKGIAGSLNSLSKRIAWEIDAFQIPTGFRVSQLITATFDPWFRDVFVPLCVGGTICIPPERPARMGPEALLEWFRDSRVNLVHCGPTLLNTLVSTPPRIRRLPDLQLALLSGEFLHVSLVSRWRRRFGVKTRLVNVYGATEATMMQFHHSIEPEDLARDFIPIGRPVPDVDVLLLDEKGMRCAPGQTGEILVGGPALSLGYFRDNQTTRGAFVEADMSDGRRAVFYRTGDLGMECADGVYRLLGRRDDQVKIRGVRVEPRAVEDALTGYPLVAACAVTVHRGDDGEPWLVAYVVPETEYLPAIPEMRAYLRARLPLEFLPAEFVFIKHLPLTENGKIDRRNLLEPERMRPATLERATAPRNPLETLLEEYWCAILGLPQVGVHEHFLDLGGHSLSAMRLLARLHEDHGLELSVADVLDHPTIAKLAIRIEVLTEARNKRLAPTPEPEADLANSETVSANLSAAGIAQTSRDGVADFTCPRAPSRYFGLRSCNLVLFLGDDGDRDSYEQVARLVETLDRTIRSAIVEDTPAWSANLPTVPTFFFSPALIRNRPKIPGCVACGFPLSKSEEYSYLARASISVPRWIKLSEHDSPNLEGFGDYVVRKPDYGAKGPRCALSSVSVYAGNLSSPRRRGQAPPCSFRNLSTRGSGRSATASIRSLGGWCIACVLPETLAGLVCAGPRTLILGDRGTPCPSYPMYAIPRRNIATKPRLFILASVLRARFPTFRCWAWMC
jgi:amino acid adenylation domain-containing protein